MIPLRRTVLVGERPAAGTSLDSTIDLVASLATDATISLAVVDRVGGQASLAVTIEEGSQEAGGLLERIAESLGALFGLVKVVESPFDPLAGPPRLT